MSEQQANPAISVFYSYAQEDKQLQAKLSKHLSGLRRQGIITEWHHGNIPAGTDQKQAIDTHLATATIILLLISPDFMASDDCYREMQRALEQNEAGISHVISILLRPISLARHPITKLRTLPQNERPVTRWENDDAAFEDIVTGISQIIEQMRTSTVVSPSIRSLNNQAPSQQLFIVPYRRNLRFTDREEILSYLHQRLQTDRVALTQAQAISGLGGIGKTQTALEYAYRYTHAYQSILWINASSVETLLTDFATIAARLQLPEYDAQDQKTAVRAVGRWLENNSGWLLILDNADDLTAIYDALPTNPHVNGQILFTTRAQAVGPDIEAIEVTKMDTQDGIQLFLTRAKKLRSGDALTTVPSQTLKDAEAIVTELDGLPLAIDQAGAFIDETGCSLDNYLQLYKTHRKSLLSWKSRYSSTYPMTVATTWSLAFQRIEQENTGATALLQFCAFLAPDAIPEEIITEGANHLGDILQSIASDVFKLNEAIEILRRYSLVRRNAEEKTLTIHRITQAVIQDSMGLEVQRQWAEGVVNVMHTIFSATSNTITYKTGQYLSHAYVCKQLIEQHKLKSITAAKVLYHIGIYLQAYARFTDAKDFYQRALALCEDIFASTSIEMARIEHKLGELYHAQDQYKEAEKHYCQALSLFEKILSNEHYETANTLQALGLLYHNQGKYQEADTYYERALSIYRTERGVKHPDTLLVIHNLASINEEQGKYQEAETRFEQVFLDEYDHNIVDLDINQNKLKMELSMITEVYSRQGPLIKIKELCQKLSARYEDIFGPEHPSIAIVLSQLAYYEYIWGELDAAAEHYQKAISICENFFGVEHVSLASPLLGLARIKDVQEKNEEAEALLLRSLSIYEKGKNPEYIATGAVLNDLGRFYKKTEKHEQAIYYYKRTIAIYEKVLGSEHADIAYALKEMVSCYYALGNYQEYEAALLRALQIEEKTLGEDLFTSMSLMDLGHLYQMQQKYEQAETYYQRALAMQEKVVGMKHSETVRTIHNYASLLRETGRPEEADTLEARLSNDQTSGDESAESPPST